ncbi:MAG TPA: dockerin type I domain-containing protein [Candidatus Saccharimonadales bacterium]|nr:dockerin type I domain-containing protein [Candidatus Saccharimonadales bacterium]
MAAQKQLLPKKFWLILTFLLFALIPLTVLTSLNQRDNRTHAATPNTISVNGNNYFLLGTNYPWSSYANDFGKNGFGDYGVHTDTGSGPYNSAFTDFKNKGVHVVRWWVFGDGRAGIVFDPSGTPTGIDSSVFQNIDAAVAIAKKNNIYLNLVFLDFSFFNNPANLGSGVIAGGHTNVFTDTTKMTSLINNVVNPIMTRYSNEPYIFSWEAMNEPEWSISDIPQPAVNSGLVPVTMQQFWSYGSQFSNLVHSKTKSLVTVGSATLKWNKIWTNSFATSKGLPALNLDYYQTHYYTWMDCCTTNDPTLGVTTWSPMTQSAAALNLDKPLVVGESDDHAASCGGDCETKVLNNGYAGYWPWSYWGGDGLTIDWQKFTAWEGSHASLVRITPPTSGSPKPGDINHDGAVNSADLALLISTWGSSTDLRADINNDGKIGSGDLALLISHWGT